MPFIPQVPVLNLHFFHAILLAQGGDSMSLKRKRANFISILFVCLILLILTCLCLLPGCSNSREESIPSTAMHDEISRQDFYNLLYHEITQDELLRSTYFPEYFEQDGANFLCGDASSFDNRENSYEALLFLTRKQKLSKLSIKTCKYRQGEDNVQTVWLWQNNQTANNMWSSFIDDFKGVSDKNRQAVTFFCNAGLAKITENPVERTYSLCPNEIISAEEKTQTRQLINSHKRFTPANAIETKDHNGNNILLSFSDTDTFFMFRNLLAYLSESNDIIDSFVYFDETGTELSLWINSYSGGMFAMPLDIGHGTLCKLPCSSDSTLIKQRLGVIRAILPSDVKEKASVDFEKIISKDWSVQKFVYTSDSRPNLEYIVSFVPSGEFGHTVYFSIKK